MRKATWNGPLTSRQLQDSGPRISKHVDSTATLCVTWLDSRHWCDNQVPTTSFRSSHTTTYTDNHFHRIDVLLVELLEKCQWRPQARTCRQIQTFSPCLRRVIPDLSMISDESHRETDFSVKKTNKTIKLLLQSSILKSKPWQHAVTRGQKFLRDTTDSAWLNCHFIKGIEIKVLQGSLFPSNHVHQYVT